MVLISIKLASPAGRLRLALEPDDMNHHLRNIIFAIALSAVCASAAPRTAAAWGDDGHVLIGVIAYQLLDPSVRAKVDAMLASDTDPLTAPDFASRTTWADKYRDAARNAARNAGSSTGTEKWHFTNVELGDGNLDTACANHPALPAGMPASNAPGCSVDKVEQFTAELANPATPAPERLLALKFLMHLVGDLHQPMHSSDNHDSGGNAVYVVPDGRFVPTKLHAYWDTEIVRAMSPLAGAGRYAPRSGPLARALLTTTADGIASEFKSRAKGWLAGRPRDWALDAFQKARDVAYRVGSEAGTSRDGRPVYRIDAAYERAAMTVAREQIAKAGVRLAGLLNGALRN